MSPLGSAVYFDWMMSEWLLQRNTFLFDLATESNEDWASDFKAADDTQVRKDGFNEALYYSFPL